MRSSVRLHSGQSQHLLCDLWFLERFGTVVRVFLAIAEWHTGFADVALSLVSQSSLEVLSRGGGGFTSGAYSLVSKSFLEVLSRGERIRTNEWCLARS